MANHDATIPHAADFVELSRVNDWLTTTLAAHGWVAATEEDYDALNDLTHDLAAQIDTALTKFVQQH